MADEIRDESAELEEREATENSEESDVEAHGKGGKLGPGETLPVQPWDEA